jgi:hypothetical protein
VEEIFQPYAPNYRKKVYSITTKFVRYIFHFMKVTYLQTFPPHKKSSHLIGRNVSFKFKLMSIDSLYFDMSVEAHTHICIYIYIYEFHIASSRTL